ncbi:Uncharacterised protein [Mycobacteroides abscessus subsp. bolletii]|uniref:hypothetical protein n=1 Tax=Mycobacteroides abscessus TaxID=36809 RepID=UPI00092B84BA|nr:hypothetical protein [Mycobacteroides abscessus]SHP62546.1 Uncharacterised protein [Mycobacteroides abscessus subsp. bolletii]SHR47616.1 Uncharacterised protein [Mycobacteroides abscessus subsp. bolletii]SHS10582.1 Uncharacterised protein [Mycobacteroides abscessus subsp. bolletii]SHS25418.1 Uncharacterised protein [Mycobacteroides abscessus subsp. bolletii]SHY52970.1 Uncharacterised protein [Mycobacteroides abscessus subsp. bolletii]
MTKLDELLTTDQAAAIDTLRSTLGVDPAADPKFWECLLAQTLSGVTTAASAAHDIDLAGIGVEVKFSREFSMVLGDNRRSNVFRWTALSGHGSTPKDASSTILVGLDRSRCVWFWVIPADAVDGTRTVTCVVPSDRRGSDRSALGGYACDTSDLLGRVLHYDAEHHAQTRQRARTAALEAQMDPMFGPEILGCEGGAERGAV